MHVTYHSAMADIHEHGDDPEAVYPRSAYIPTGGTPVRSRKYVAIPSSGWSLQVSILPAHYLEAMRGQPTLALNILKAFQDGPITVRQTEGRFNGVWIYIALQQTYRRDVNTKSFTGISQQLTAMEKYMRALPVLTAESGQTKAITVGSG